MRALPSLPPILPHAYGGPPRRRCPGDHLPPPAIGRRPPCHRSSPRSGRLGQLWRRYLGTARPHHPHCNFAPYASACNRWRPAGPQRRHQRRGLAGGRRVSGGGGGVGGSGCSGGCSVTTGWRRRYRRQTRDNQLRGGHAGCVQADDPSPSFLTSVIAVGCSDDETNRRARESRGGDGNKEVKCRSVDGTTATPSAP